MTKIGNTGFGVGSVDTVRRQEEPTRAEVKQLAEMYDRSIDAARAEKFMWNKMQQEGHLAIEDQVRKGQISEKVALVRGLMNDAIAHRAYQRLAAQTDQDIHRYTLLKNEYPEILNEEAV